ncbi:hypothetical protein SAMN06295900_101246 [Trinickia caryophylli]|uniref:Probable membrane transporter protein n=2 Tax=Trinickia caryophylli TaxID=28094 RepID=A0A1X7CDP4_TRICW|nr:hypothetical protein SAMN06295900_101246 [Trinickia caryophylli]
MHDTALLGAALGSVVGVILALTGAGGGIVAVPLLVFGLGVDVATASPVGLVAVGLAAALGTWLGLREARVRYKAAALMALSGSLASPAGLWLARRIPNTPLMLLFSILLLYVAWRLLQQANNGAQPHPEARRHEPACHLDPVRGKLAWSAPCARALATSGLVAGLLSGLLGVGGGFVVVPALRRASDIPMEGIIATSLAVIALVSATGVVASAASGHMPWAVAIPFAAGAVAGMLGGRRIARHLSAAKIQKSFATFAGMVAIGMAAKALFGS